MLKYVRIPLHTSPSSFANEKIIALRLPTSFVLHIEMLSTNIRVVHLTCIFYPMVNNLFAEKNIIPYLILYRYLL